MFEGNFGMLSKKVETAIENKDIKPEQLPQGSPIQKEAKQIYDSNPRNDEVRNDAVEDFIKQVETTQPSKQEQDEAAYRKQLNDMQLVDDINPNIDNYEMLHFTPEEAAETLTDEAKEEAEQILDDDRRNDEVNNSNLPALSLQDYNKDLAINGERDLAEDVDYTVVEDSDYIPPVYTIEDLDKEIEEVGQWPVANVDEAKAKQNKLKELKARRVEYGSTSASSTNWDYDKSGATGGKVSPRAGIGSIGGAAGHGNMASTSSTKIGDNHNSIASKAPLPHALEDNQGRVVSVNGKATTAPSSNNNGAFRSGSFGLMSKASSNLKSVPSKAPVSGGAKHTGSSTMGSNGMPEINLDDGKQLLIERLEQLITQLTDEEKKEFGFSAALNQWNGKALSKLDGYTLQDLIDKVEEYLEEK